MKALYGDILESFLGWVAGQACDGLRRLAGMSKRQEALKAHLLLFKTPWGVPNELREYYEISEINSF